MDISETFAGVVRVKKFLHFIQTLCAIYLSRKFIVTLTFFGIMHGIYWQATTELFAFTSPDQIHAYVTIYQTSIGVLGSIALGYLGFSKASPNLASYVGGSPSNFDLPKHQTGASTKNEP